MKTENYGPPPVTVGKIVRLEIKDLNHAGEGVGSFEGFAIFVPGTAPGDLVTARVVMIHKTYARAEVESVERESAGRVAPPCLDFDRCGGCQLQHIAYHDQLIFKQQLLRETLRRIGGLSVPVLPVLGMAEPWRYRNKAHAPVAAGGGRLKAGFYERYSHRVVDLKDCPIQHPAGMRAIVATREALHELNIPAYDQTGRRGVIRHILTRYSFSSGELLLLLVTGSRKLPNADRLVEQLRARIPNLAGIVQNINHIRDSAVLGREDLTLWGSPFLIDQIGDLRFRVSARSFSQVNPSQTGVLYRQVLNYAGLDGQETVFDLYCGTGTISLFLAGSAGRVIGVEADPAAVRDARANAAINEIKNAQFYNGPAEKVLPRLLEEGLSANKVIVDPPRRGCRPELLAAAAASGASRIVYVSCNPATMARDLKILAGHGYKAREAQPVDMFPHTSHVEVVVLMLRVEK